MSLSMTITRSAGQPSATACCLQVVLPLKALGVLGNLGNTLLAERTSTRRVPDGWP